MWSTLVACVAIVAFDAITAVAATPLSFDYGGFPGVIASNVIYAFPAVMAVREGRRLRAAALAGATVAAVDATIGWAVAWVIGPGAPPPGSGPLIVLLAATTVVGIGALTGLLAGFVTRKLSGLG